MGKLRVYNILYYCSIILVVVTPPAGLQNKISVRREMTRKSATLSGRAVVAVAVAVAVDEVMCIKVLGGVSATSPSQQQCRSTNNRS